MAKGKIKSSTKGPRKSHGPKRKLFKNFKPLIAAFAQSGLLDKFNNYESWVLACNARGKKSTPRDEFNKFFILTRAEKIEFFNSLRGGK